MLIYRTLCAFPSFDTKRRLGSYHERLRTPFENHKGNPIAVQVRTSFAISPIRWQCVCDISKLIWLTRDLQLGLASVKWDFPGNPKKQSQLGKRKNHRLKRAKTQGFISVILAGIASFLVGGLADLELSWKLVKFWYQNDAAATQLNHKRYHNDAIMRKHVFFKPTWLNISARCVQPEC